MSDPVIRIMAVDDHPIFRQGIISLLADQPGMRLVAEAANGQEAIRLFRETVPDITLLDLHMPDLGGLPAIKTIREEFPEAKIIVLTTYRGDAQAVQALKAGARAYILKSTLHRRLLQTIRDVWAGKKTVSPEVAVELAEHAVDDVLTPAEIRVLRMIAEGNANKEIAAALYITEEAVKGRVKSILLKLSAKDRTHAVTIALKRGIIELP